MGAYAYVLWYAYDEMIPSYNGVVVYWHHDGDGELDMLAWSMAGDIIAEHLVNETW